MQVTTPKQATKDSIKATKAYLNLSEIARKMISKKINYQKIQNGVHVASNRGFDFWVQNYHPSYAVKEIVKELIEQ